MPQSQETLSSRYALTRPPRDDDELYELVQALWGVVVPRHKVCPEHCAPFDWFADSFFARAPQTLVHGSRGLSGKSFSMATLGLTQAVVWGADVNVLGGSLAQSMNLHEHMRSMWDYHSSPNYMIEDESSIQIRLTNHARIRPLTASQKTVRGPHPARLLLDEIDEMDYNILQAAMGQPMPQKNWMGVPIPAATAMASTWQNADGTFAKEYQRFKENNLPIYTWCYKDTANPIDGWLTQEVIDQKKLEIPAEMWRVEYELGEPSIGNRAIDSEAVERMFAANPPKAVKLAKAYQEYHMADYDSSFDYVIAADWAKSQDFTVISVWRASDLPATLVHYVRVNRQPYPVMIGIYNKLMKQYHAEGIHDATGLGGVVADLIDGMVWNYVMVGRDRDNMLSNYVAAIENDKVRAVRIPEMYNAHKYCRVEDLYSRSQEYHLPDEVASGALAWKVIGNRWGLSAEPVGLPKTDSTWMNKMFEQNQDLGYLSQISRNRKEGEVSVVSDVDESWSMS